jgi:hypothetical protein
MSGCGVSGYGMSDIAANPSLSPWRRHEGHVFGFRIPVFRWGAVFRNGVKLWKLR